MNEHPIESPTGSELAETNDDKQKQAKAIEFLLARVPVIPEEESRSTNWVESDGGKTDPHGIY